MGAGSRPLPSWFGPTGLLLVIVLLGTGAALLAGTAPVTAHVAGPSLMIWLPAQAWAVIFVAPLIVGFFLFLLQLALSLTVRSWTRLAVTAGVLLLAGALLAGLVLNTNWSGNTPVSVSHTKGTGTAGSGGGGSGGGSGKGNGTGSGNGSSGSGTGGNGTSGNGTAGNGTDGNGTLYNGTGEHGRGGNRTGGNGTSGGTGSGSNGTGRNNTSGGLLGTGSVGTSGLRLPNWVFLSIAAGISVAVGLAMFPGALSRFTRRRPAPTPLPTAAVGPPGVLSAVADPRFRGLANESPREAIVRLYGTLLGKVGLSRDDLAPFTAEEIQRTRLASLHVSAAPAETLTQIFEEACYSAHPVGATEVARFVENARAVEHELFVGGVVP